MQGAVLSACAAGAVFCLWRPRRKRRLGLDDDAETTNADMLSDLAGGSKTAQSKWLRSILRLTARIQAAPAISRANSAFDSLARLDKAAFFECIRESAHIDLSKSPFADTLFVGWSNGGMLGCSTGCRAFSAAPNAGATRAALDIMLRDLQAARVLFHIVAGGKPITREQLPAISKKLLGGWVSDKAASDYSVSYECDPADYIDETFTRYDNDADGLLNEAEFCTMMLVHVQMLATFNSIASDSAAELDKQQYESALVRLGFADPAKVFQAQLADAVFARADANRNGKISRQEFMRAVGRLLRPRWTGRLKQVPGWPGDADMWKAAALGSAEALVAFVNGLQTGDVVLSSVEGALGNYLNFGLDSAWNHAAVVVRRSDLGGDLCGIANEKTEELLQRFPFRRATHKFCSPGYCRCFDTSDGDYAPSWVKGTADVCLLESSGEGIHRARALAEVHTSTLRRGACIHTGHPHSTRTDAPTHTALCARPFAVYDLVHRLFLSGEPGRYSAIAIRRLADAPPRKAGHTAALACFVRRVRGSLYSTVKNELKESVELHVLKPYRGASSNDDARRKFHDLQDGGTPLAELPREKHSHFCSKVVAELHQDLGVMASARPANTVMPGDYSGEEGRLCSATLTRPVQLAPGQGHFEPLHILWSADLGVPLPLRPPRKKK